VTGTPVIERQTGHEWQVVRAERTALPSRAHVIVKGKMASKQGGIANEIVAEPEEAGINGVYASRVASKAYAKSEVEILYESHEDRSEGLQNTIATVSQTWEGKYYRRRLRERGTCPETNDIIC
jgi:hypothetical protein